MSNGEEKSGKGLIVKVLLIAIVLIAAVGIAGYLYVDSLAYGRITLEAGGSISASDILKTPDPNAFYMEGSDEINTGIPGVYNVTVKSGYFSHKSIVTVVDSIAPTGEAVENCCGLGDSLSANEFVTNIFDATKVSVSFNSVPDFNIYGNQPVEILLTDEAGNSSIITSKLTVLPFTTTLSVEAGSRLPMLKDFALSDESFQCISNIEEIVSMNSVASYELEFAYDSERYTVIVNVEDTVAPEVEFKDFFGCVGQEFEADVCVVSANDITTLTYSFDQEIPEEEGEYEVAVLVTDEGGNVTSETRKVTLVVDEEAPEVSILGDIVIVTGNSVPYLSNITVSDNCPEGIDIQIDNENVDNNVAGQYPITYTVTDVGGNVVTVSCNVIVNERLYNMDEIDAAADAVLATIITDDMSDYQKAEKIFDWVRAHVGFMDKSEKTSFARAAYEGIIGSGGDCYVYACTSQELLTRAGIKNILIERIPTKTTHFWNLVDYGSGWYHFDTTPRIPDHPRVFMWNEAELQAYSASHYRCYNYDHSQYPETN